MAKFSIPFNGDMELIKKVVSTGKIDEVYYALPEELDCSLTGANTNKKGVLGYGDVDELSEYLGKKGIRRNVLCNHPFLSFFDLNNVIDYLKQNRVECITIADPFFVSKFKENLFGVEVQASVLSFFDSYDKVRNALKIGFDSINLPPDLNQDLRMLKKIASLKKEFPNFKIKLLVNNASCVSGCCAAPFHNNLLLKDLVKNQKLFFGKLPCKAHLKDDSILRNGFIRPEDLGYYEGEKVVDVFKLCRRSYDSNRLANIYDAYLNGRYEGYVYEIMSHPVQNEHIKIRNEKFPKGFVEKISNCDGNCGECDYCKKLIKDLQ